MSCLEDDVVENIRGRKRRRNEENEVELSTAILSLLFTSALYQGFVKQ